MARIAGLRVRGAAKQFACAALSATRRQRRAAPERPGSQALLQAVPERSSSVTLRRVSRALMSSGCSSTFRVRLKAPDSAAAHTEVALRDLVAGAHKHGGLLFRDLQHDVVLLLLHHNLQACKQWAPADRIAACHSHLRAVARNTQHILTVRLGRGSPGRTLQTGSHRTPRNAGGKTQNTRYVLQRVRPCLERAL